MHIRLNPAFEQPEKWFVMGVDETLATIRHAAQIKATGFNPWRCKRALFMFKQDSCRDGRHIFFEAGTVIGNLGYDYLSDYPQLPAPHHYPDGMFSGFIQMQTEVVAEICGLDQPVIMAILAKMYLFIQWNETRVCLRTQKYKGGK